MLLIISICTITAEKIKNQAIMANRKRNVQLHFMVDELIIPTTK